MEVEEPSKEEAGTNDTNTPANETVDKKSQDAEMAEVEQPKSDAPK